MRANAQPSISDDAGEDLDATPRARRRAPVSTLVSLALVAIAGTAIAWNALYNQRPKATGVTARTIELTAQRPAAQPAVKPKPQSAARPAKPAASAGAAEVAVKAAPAKAGAGGAPAQTVAALQAQLAVLGVYAGPANGALDAATLQAVDAYRARHGLDAGLALDGVLDHARFAAEIVQAANFRPEGDGAAAGFAPDAAGAAAADRDQVLFVQKGLAELGYAPGPADGRTGEITRRAIRDFQAERRLPVTGEITPELIDELKKTSGLTTFLSRP